MSKKFSNNSHNSNINIKMYILITFKIFIIRPSIEFMVAKLKVWNILLEENRWKISDSFFKILKTFLH
jgi:hypothetical protein